MAVHRKNLVRSPLFHVRLGNTRFGGVWNSWNWQPCRGVLDAGESVNKHCMVEAPCVDHTARPGGAQAQCRERRRPTGWCGVKHFKPHFRWSFSEDQGGRSGGSSRPHSLLTWWNEQPVHPDCTPHASLVSPLSSAIAFATSASLALALPQSNAAAASQNPRSSPEERILPVSLHVLR